MNDRGHYNKGVLKKCRFAAQNEIELHSCALERQLKLQNCFQEESFFFTFIWDVEILHLQVSNDVLRSGTNVREARWSNLSIVYEVSILYCAFCLNAIRSILLFRSRETLSVVSWILSLAPISKVLGNLVPGYIRGYTHIWLWLIQVVSSDFSFQLRGWIYHIANELLLWFNMFACNRVVLA